MSGRYCTLLGIALLVLVFFSIPAIAQEKPIQLSLFTPVQIFPEDTAIKGIRLSLIYGRSVSVTGLDWGLVNHTTTGDFVGVQFGAVGYTEANFTGWQDNWVNVVKGNMEGLQWGVVNYAHYAHGLQLGLVNYAGSMKGLQIGFVNIIKQGGAFPVFPIVNWSF
ncbi:MAG: hypothetical protein GY839_14905 [candidate division Zixibacteria bacterium]|nr:hypothetical protein [candidate division Zixibacteria bacterium]